MSGLGKSRDDLSFCSVCQIQLACLRRIQLLLAVMALLRIQGLYVLYYYTYTLAYMGILQLGSLWLADSTLMNQTE